VVSNAVFGNGFESTTSALARSPQRQTFPWSGDGLGLLEKEGDASSPLTRKPD